jgi:hypothetical protein
MSLGKVDVNYQRMEKQQKIVKKEVVVMESDEELESTVEEEKRKKGVVLGKKGASSGNGSSGNRCCQAENCTVDLSDAKAYHRRHKVCEHHAKAQAVVVGGIRQRFCQQCSRFYYGFCFWFCFFGFCCVCEFHGVLSLTPSCCC